MDGQYPANPNGDTDKDDRKQSAKQASGSWAEDYMQHAKDYRKKHRHNSWLRTLLTVVIVVIVLGAGGFGGYWLIKHHKNTKPTTSATSQTPPAATSSTSSGTTNYTAKGSDLNLAFNYPSNWTATPATGTDTTDQAITVTSPLVTIPGASGGDTTGKVIFTIRPGTANLSELNANNPIAAVASTQIAYSQPTPNQHQYTYLTFVHFSNGSSTPGAFEEILVTGVTQFTAAQAVTQVSMSGVDPIIGVNIDKCLNQACTGANEVPLSITTSTWQNTPLFQQVVTLLESLQLN